MSTAFTDIAQELAETAGLRIGVAENAGECALAYAGMNTLRKYFGGVKKIELLFTISGADEADRQQALIERLIGKIGTLTAYTPQTEGLERAEIHTAYPPKAVVYNGKYWIYNAGIKVSCYTKMR